MAEHANQPSRWTSDVTPVDLYQSLEVSLLGRLRRRNPVVTNLQLHAVVPGQRRSPALDVGQLVDDLAWLRQAYAVNSDEVRLRRCAEPIT